MNLTDDLRGSRLTLIRAAELAGMHPAHFRRLIRQGIFPKAKKTAKGRPYFDYELLARVAEMLTSGIGANGQEVLFYRRKNSKPAVRHLRRLQPPDPYLKTLAEGLRGLGISREQLTDENLKAVVEAAFGKERPDLPTAIPVIMRRLLA
jgi:hypothetical protein